MLCSLNTSYHVFQQDTGLCKNLLQDYAHKMNYGYPSYIWDKQTSGVGPSICTVEIGGIKYIGAAAHTKKEAQIKAAQTALLAIQGIFSSSDHFERGVFLVQS
jgi:dsRNA-specific ribonuclease